MKRAIEKNAKQLQCEQKFCFLGAHHEPTLVQSWIKFQEPTSARVVIGYRKEKRLGISNGINFGTGVVAHPSPGPMMGSFSCVFGASLGNISDLPINGGIFLSVSYERYPAKSKPSANDDVGEFLFAFLLTLVWLESADSTRSVFCCLVL
jgi:hypothetical protein